MFMVTVFICGLSNAGTDGFLFLVMKDEMHSTKTTMGLATVVSDVVEVVMFPISNFLIKRFGDMECLIFSLFTNAIRCVLLAFIKKLLDSPPNTIDTRDRFCIILRLNGSYHV